MDDRELQAGTVVGRHQAGSGGIVCDTPEEMLMGWDLLTALELWSFLSTLFPVTVREGFSSPSHL